MNDGLSMLPRAEAGSFRARPLSKRNGFRGSEVFRVDFPPASNASNPMARYDPSYALSGIVCAVSYRLPPGAGQLSLMRCFDLALLALPGLLPARPSRERPNHENWS
jgi:hypothetical protein